MNQPIIIKLLGYEALRIIDAFSCYRWAWL
jgi:hypothetical protein